MRENMWQGAGGYQGSRRKPRTVRNKHTLPRITGTVPDRYYNTIVRIDVYCLHVYWTQELLYDMSHISIYVFTIAWSIHRSLYSRKDIDKYTLQNTLVVCKYMFMYLQIANVEIHKRGRFDKPFYRRYF